MMNRIIFSYKNANGETQEANILFGSWVLGQLSQRGWGISVIDVLQKIADNPSDSMALLIHLGLCNAEKRTVSLTDRNIDDVYDIIDSLSFEELEKVKDTFLSASYGENIIQLIKDAIAKSKEEGVIAEEELSTEGVEKKSVKPRRVKK